MRIIDAAWRQPFSQIATNFTVPITKETAGERAKRERPSVDAREVVVTLDSESDD